MFFRPVYFALVLVSCVKAKIAKRELNEWSGFPCTGGATFEGTEGELLSEGYDGLTLYLNNQYCKWTIQNDSPNNKILITFENFDVEYNSRCLNDHVEIFTGNTDDTKYKILRLCGHDAEISPILIDNHVVTLAFSSDLSMGGTGFRAKFVAVSAHSVLSSGCATQLYNTKDNSFVTSIGYPSRYHGLYDCVFHIIAPTGKMVYGYMDDIDLNSFGDQVRLHNGYDLQSSYQGFYTTKKQGGILSSGNAITLHFLTYSSSNEGIGFKFKYKFVTEGELNMATTPFTDMCGISNKIPKPSGKIVGGYVAAKQAWPWLVTVRQCADQIFASCQPFCGGTLISKKWAISAAHCYVNRRVWVVAGDFNRAINEYGEQISEVKQIVHPDHSTPSEGNNDIMLLELLDPFKFNEYVKPACLPTPDLEIPKKVDCFIAGFGVLEFEGVDKPFLLNELLVPILSNSHCTSVYQNIFTDNMICAGYEEGGKDACQGDSGGPLICRTPNDAAWVLTGVVSFGHGCAWAGYPGVYAKVNKYTDWIKSVTGDVVPNYDMNGRIPEGGRVNDTTPVDDALVQADLGQDIEDNSGKESYSCDAPTIIDGGSGEITSTLLPVAGYFCEWLICKTEPDNIIILEIRINSIMNDGLLHPTCEMVAIYPKSITHARANAIYPLCIETRSRVFGSRDGFTVEYNSLASRLADFSIMYKEVPTCPLQQILDTSNDGNITTPGYPGAYTRGTACTWIIRKLKSTKQIILSVIKFSLLSATCDDSVVIKDVKEDGRLEEFGPYCNSQLPPGNISFFGDVEIVFASNLTTAEQHGPRSKSEIGFFIEYRRISDSIIEFETFSEDSAKECEDYITVNTSPFTSENVKCNKWNINVMETHGITLAIDPFFKPSFTGDLSEYVLKVYEGSGMKLVLRIDFHQLMYEYKHTSVTNIIKLEFIRPNMNDDVGFRASYVEVSGAPINRPTLSLSFLVILATMHFIILQ